MKEKFWYGVLKIGVKMHEYVAKKAKGQVKLEYVVKWNDIARQLLELNEVKYIGLSGRIGAANLRILSDKFNALAEAQ